jgi:hypothetical protein
MLESAMSNRPLLPFCLVFFDLLAPSPAMAEEYSPRAWIAALPAPPTVYGADCEWAALDARAEAEAAKAQAAAVASASMGAGSMAVSDAQGAAIEALTSERVTQCPMGFVDAQMQVEAALDASQRKVAGWVSDRFAARDACPHVDGFPEAGCVARVDREFLARAEAEVRHVIGSEVQPRLRKFDADIAACIGDREAAAKKARDAGVTAGPFAGIVASMPMMDWQLAASAMALHRRSCEYVQTALADFQIQQ